MTLAIYLSWPLTLKQVLPLILTISPLFSLWEALLKKRVCGPTNNFKQRLRFCLERASGLQRRDAPTGQPDDLPEHQLTGSCNPSPFAVLTVNGTDFFNTFDQDDTQDPFWNECFDAEVVDTSIVVIRVFDMRGKGQLPTLMGQTVVSPYTMLFAATRFQHRDDDSDPSTLAGPSNLAPETGTISQAFPLMLNEEIVPGASIIVSISRNTTDLPQGPNIPARYVGGTERATMEGKVSFFTWRGRKFGHKESKRTETHHLVPDLHDERCIELKELSV